MKNRIKRNTERIKKLQEGKNFKQKGTHSQTLDTEGHLGKGSKRRPQVVSDKDFQDAWDKIFPRKVTPKHGATQIHENKKKSDKYWDSDFEEQCRELYGDNMPDIEDSKYLLYPDCGDID